MNGQFRAHKKTFRDVLHNGENQVIVRELVDQLMTPEQKVEMIRLFNADIDRYNAVVAQQRIQQEQP